MFALAASLLFSSWLSGGPGVGYRGEQVLTRDAYVDVDWKERTRELVLTGWPLREGAFHRAMELREPLAFELTAAAGCSEGRLLLAGREGALVCVELWSLVDDARGPDPAAVRIVERRRIWERLDADSIDLVVWNPRPPAGALDSFRVVWRASRELGRLDLEGSGWCRYRAERSLAGAASAELPGMPLRARPLRTRYAYEREGHGLRTVLQTSDSDIWFCEGGLPSPPLCLVVLEDRDLDGFLDDVRVLDWRTWEAEGLEIRTDDARLDL